MKTRFLFLLVLISSYCFSQSVNDYKTILIPLRFDFIKTDNQYRLVTLSKFNLNKAGFQAFYNNEPLAKENNDRCSLMYFDVVKENAFLTTKLYITIKDCNGKIIFKSNIGTSKEKDYELAYAEALNKAFISIYDLQYKYNDVGNSNSIAVSKPEVATVPVRITEVVLAQETVKQVVVSQDAIADNSKILYAQPTATGFQLIDSTPKVIIKVYNTSRKDCFIAVKENVQGVLFTKDNQWFFEYYLNDKLISEKVDVKF
ncbi:hypothetical protein [Flavobacterium sp.]|uniref:hypothetical protein n=1 Tax=Flavobacterium sp. TaxID=239 RepID=UPI001B44E8A1|nr:hypothetical protein [Flavobacterium sp.]MBP6180924.1 hypothetical protein [Flavobacterium sp.]